MAEKVYIERDELESRIKKYVKCRDADRETLEWAKDECIRQAHCMPAADVVEVVHARWIWNEENECFVCSNCELSALNDYRGDSTNSNYCPNCGAKMDGERRC